MTNAAPAAPIAGAPAPAPHAGAAGARADGRLAGVDPGARAAADSRYGARDARAAAQRTEQIRAFIDKGAFASVYVPAFQAKDLALALDEHKRELPDERRKRRRARDHALVRSAWLLDAFGDIGNKQQISEAYAQFVDAVKDIESAFPQPAMSRPP